MRTRILAVATACVLGVACDSGGDSSIQTADTVGGTDTTGGDGSASDTGGGGDTGGTDDTGGGGVEDGGGDDAGGGGDAGGGDAGGGDAGGGDTGGGGGDPLILDGLWYTSVEVVPLGGLRLDLQLEIDSSANGSGGGSIDTLIIRAVGKDKLSVSDDLAMLQGIAVANDGTFLAEFVGVTLPAEYTVTGSDLLVDVVFHGTIKGDDFICGDVTGSVAAIGLDLASSTFGAVPWGTQTDPAIASCDTSGGGDEYEHIETCPAITAGLNTGFVTAGEDRSFRVYLPDDHDTAKASPVAFLYHGLGGSAQGIVDDSGIVEPLTDAGFVVIVPESLGLGIEWEQQTTDPQNRDLFLFDDALKCADESLNLDLERVYVTGMSAGGLFTAFLSSMRADVIAAVAPMSGGLITNYTKPSGKLPAVVTWGGPEDKYGKDGASEQNFATFAANLIADYLGNGQFVVACEHELGHEWSPDVNLAVVEFFLDHPKGVSPEPYLTELPAAFPAWCSIAD
ncbi:MAG: hypothetical protein AMXMBFR64_10400 [Myxococcales bacterium]